jgi:deoxyribonuclease V
MILAIDVHYKDQVAKSVGLLFKWSDKEPEEILIDYLINPADYIAGEFYKRERPCLLKIIEKVDLNNLEAIIIDGYVYIDNNREFGLGGYVWQALKEKIPIIGVAKNYYYGNAETVKQIIRGNSKKPLYVSAIGITLEEALSKIADMFGEFRIPTILKLLDTITKE